MSQDASRQPCLDCGLVGAGGDTGCLHLYREMWMRVIFDHADPRVCDLMKNAYALQHPDSHCATGRSLAAHLTRLCWFMEWDDAFQAVPKALQAWLGGCPLLERPAVPRFRGRITLAEARAARDPLGLERAVEGWARGTWVAYTPLHATARGWIRQAMAEVTGSRAMAKRRLMARGRHGLWAR